MRGNKTHEIQKQMEITVKLNGPNKRKVIKRRFAELNGLRNFHNWAAQNYKASRNVNMRPASFKSL